MLTKRLQTIVDATPNSGTIADVGCDHGYVGIELLVTGKAQKVVFVDVSAPSLQKAKNNCPLQFADSVDFVCADGLGDVACDCAIIAGMGGLETISILSNATHKPQALVLQPMRNQVDVRRWLLDNGYGILRDKMFVDMDKYYDLVVAVQGGGTQTLDNLQLCFGKDNLVGHNDDFCQFLHKKIDTYKRILNNCDDKKVDEQLQLACRALEYISEELA